MHLKNKCLREKNLLKQNYMKNLSCKLHKKVCIGEKIVVKNSMLENG